METYDIVIVGGGIAGASLGARLVVDRRVLIIEAEDLCGRHATGRSGGLWQASLGGDTPERRLTLASRPLFDARWPGSESPLLRTRGAVHDPCRRRRVRGAGRHGQGIRAGPSRPGGAGPADARPQPQWTGAWYEGTCADIEAAAFHNACLAAVRRGGGVVRTDAELLRARESDGGWIVETSAGTVAAAILVTPPAPGASRWRRAPESPASAWFRNGERWCSCESGGAALGTCRSSPTSTKASISRARATTASGSARSTRPPVDPCDAAPEEIDVATAIDRFEKAVDWPVEAVERKWAGLRTFAPTAA